MQIRIVATVSLAAVLILSTLVQTLATDMPMAAAMDTKTSSPSADDQKLIESAIQAVPEKVGKGATVIAMDKDGKMRTIRPGTNGFTCMPDNPVTPGPDPMCMDKNAMEWVNAWMAHKTPADGKVGLMYMLSGGTDASNTDPYATQPTVENHWVKTGPHVMVVGAGTSFYDLYPKDADPNTSVPYVMWAGTPYQHLMVPVR